MGNQLGGALERIAYGHVAAVSLAEVLFVNDEATTDGVVGLAVNHFIFDQGSQLHAIFVQRQGFVVEYHGVTREADGVAVQADRQALGLLNTGDKLGDGIDIDIFRQVAWPLSSGQQCGKKRGLHRF